MKKSSKGRDAHLFVDRITITEDRITGNATGDKAIVWPFFTAVCISQEDGEEFVKTDELCQVERMLSCSFEDVTELLHRRSTSEEEGHDQRMWKSNLGTVHCTVSRSFQYCEKIMIGRIQGQLLYVLGYRPCRRGRHPVGTMKDLKLKIGVRCVRMDDVVVNGAVKPPLRVPATALYLRRVAL